MDERAKRTARQEGLYGQEHRDLGEDRADRFRPRARAAERAPENPANPVDLVERTHRRFPSPTITTDRAHPSYPAAA